MFDYHVHSKFSVDGKMSMSEACIRAIELGISEIAFTDHVDLDWPDNVFPTFKFDALSNYIESIESVKAKFQSSINIKKGLEIGIQPHTLEESSRIATSFPFDFVLASVHIVDRKDPSLPSYFENKTKEQSFTRYYEEVLDLVKSFSDFSCLGHLDYVRRYSPYPYNEDDNAIGSDVIDEILRTLITKGKGIEVNTSGYRNAYKMPMPHFGVVKRYKELGGEILTLGSDAHNTRSIGYCFKEALEGIKKAGFTNLTAFSDMKPH